MNNELGITLKKNRIRLGLSQIELSKITGVDPKTISLIERGIRRKPHVDTILKLAEVLECIDIRLLYLAGYTQNDIKDLIRLIEDDTYKYNFTITIKGQGITYAGDEEEAREYAEEDINDCITMQSFKDDSGEVLFNDDNVSILVDFEKSD